MHKRTLTPVKSLVYGLRRYDLDRCQAMVGSYNPEADVASAKGYMTHTSKVYLVRWSHPFQPARRSDHLYRRMLWTIWSTSYLQWTCFLGSQRT